MIRWFENTVSQLAHRRGGTAVVELAALAALWPYVAASPRLDTAASAYAAAASLLVTLILLVAMRVAVQSLWPPMLTGIVSGQRDAAGENAAHLGASADSMGRGAEGLLGRAELSTIIERHDAAPGAAALGLVRFANHAPMSAFNQAAAGRVMAAFVRRLEGAVSTTRLLSQISEDSFAIWFADPDSPASADAELKAIAYVLAQEIEDTDLTVAPDIHLGSALLADCGDGAAGLFAQAQASLKPLKRFAESGKSATQPISTESLADRFAMEQALRRAVRHGELSLRYQPFVDAAKGHVAGAEVLLRWRHPTLGDISPMRFVPLLEETGLVHEIGLWTLNSACRQLHAWRSTGQHDLRLAINLSAVQLQDRSLKTMIERTVASHGLSPADVELELTETAAMEDQERTLEVFRELRDLGFGIAIDDFGRGHSNLNQLKNLPFTKLKIDREFIAGVDSNSGCQAICKAMIELGAGLGISVLAEGVERFEEVVALRRLGCHVFQGFYFARPMLADELTEKLADPDWIAFIGSDIHRSRTELQRRIAS
jgi:EAL domain-containing protein (putative c-di-GMP-specific phosphodiesterase class I)